MTQRALSMLLPAMIAPWLLLVAAWKSSSERDRHWLLTFFVTIYGATISIAYDPLGHGPDGVRHLLRVYHHYLGMGFAQFSSELWQILTLRKPPGTNDDVYIHVVSYISGGFLGDPRFFFPIVAFVYGYFFTGSLLEIFRHVRLGPRSYFFIGFAVLFFLVKNIEGVNTVRTWTGMWILVYACLKYYSTRRKRYLALMFAPPLFHFGYYVMAIPAWLFLLLGNKKRLIAVVFVASSFTTFINPGSVTEVISISELGAAKVDSYYVEEVQDKTDPSQRIWLWLQKFGLQKWALNVFIYTLLLSGVYTSRMNRIQTTIFSIGLLTLALSNSTWYLYAVSNRSWIIGCVFTLAAFLMFLQDPKTAGRVPRSNQVYKVGNSASLLLFVPYIAYNLSTLMDFPSVYLFALPFLAVLNPESNVSLKEFAQDVLSILFG